MRDTQKNRPEIPMANNRRKFKFDPLQPSLLNLPDGVVLYMMDFMDRSNAIKSILNLSCSSSYQTIFKPHLECYRLLKYVDDANYANAEMMVKRNPELMFQLATVDEKNPDNARIKITPLMQAFKNYDTHMWILFWEAIKHNPKFIYTFHKQRLTQIEHINLDSLFAEYENFLKLFHRWNNPSMYHPPTILADEKIIEAWRSLGRKQFLEIPKHMLKVPLCEPAFVWMESSFDANNSNRPSTTFFNKSTGFHIDLLNLTNSSTSKADRIFIRGDISQAIWMHWPGSHFARGYRGMLTMALQRDIQSFTRLFQRRKTELMESEKILEYVSMARTTSKQV